MTVLDIVKQAVLVLDLDQPSVLFSSTDRTWLEMAQMVNTCVKQILEEYDWQRLIKTATITGDGVSLSFPLPADYDRMVKDANLWTPTYTYYPSQQVQDFNLWLQMQSWAIETWQPRWMLYGGNLNVMPVLPTGDTLAYGYISNALVSGADTSKFTADTDNFVLDDELLRLSIIWNWKKAKGYDFQAEAAEYAEAINRARFKDVGARQTIISGRGSGRSWNTSGQVFP